MMKASSITRIPFGVAWFIATCLATWVLVAAGSGPADDARGAPAMQETTHQR